MATTPSYKYFDTNFDSNPDPDIFGNLFLIIGIICPNRICPSSPLLIPWISIADLGWN